MKVIENVGISPQGYVLESITTKYGAEDALKLLSSGKDLTEIPEFQDPVDRQFAFASDFELRGNAQPEGSEGVLR